MKTKFGLLHAMVAIAMVIMINATAAMAAESSWEWTGVVGGSFTITLTDSNYTESIYISDSENSLDTDHYVRLAAGGDAYEPGDSQVWSFYIGYNNKTNTYAVGTSISVEEGNIDVDNAVMFLDDLNFYFIYSNNESLDSVYSATGSSGVYYISNDGDNTFTMQTTSVGATPSTVPVPSSALLLGSSILGLVGLGSRRKKA